MSADTANAGDDVISLTVVEVESSQHDRVQLADEVRSKLELLTGDRVLLSGPDETITVQAWVPETVRSVGENEVALTKAQRRALGADAGDEVTISPARPGDGDLFSASTTSSNATAATDGGMSDIGVGDSSATTGGNTGGNASASDGDDDFDTEEPGVDVSYDDVGGLDNELEEVREAIELPLEHPEVFDDLGVDPPKGVLMYGPPGTGKTLIGKAVANEVDARFLHINGPEIMSKYKGESEQRLRDVFSEARQEGNAIIFFDEIDSLAGDRDDAGDDADERIVSQLLTLMDGMDSDENVVVIGSTNRPDAVDNALRRGGRFDREVEIGVPDEEGRQEIFNVHTRNMPLGDDVSIEEYADRTHGYVGADIAALCREAAMETLRRCKTEEGGFEGRNGKHVHKEDFETALSRVEPSAMREFVAEQPSTTFDDVGGLDDAKTALRRNIQWPLSYTDLFEETDTDPAPGVLIHGDTGTGKSLLARALAGESDVNFIHVVATELMDKYVGESEEAVRELFKRARQAAPSIVFIDDLDSIASDSTMGESDVQERVVSQLNNELDALRKNPNVTVVGAARNPDDISSKLLGTGKFEEKIELTEPDYEERVEIFEIHIDDTPLAENVDVEEMAQQLEGVAGGDIEALVREASMRAIEEEVRLEGIEEANANADEIEVAQRHFDHAREDLGLDD